MAAALDEGVVEPDTKCIVCWAAQVTEYTINTWNINIGPTQTMTEVLVHSDNVGMVFAAEQLGWRNFTDYLEILVLANPTGIDLKGRGCDLRPLKTGVKLIWRPLLLDRESPSRRFKWCGRWRRLPMRVTALSPLGQGFLMTMSRL